MFMIVQEILKFLNPRAGQLIRGSRLNDVLKLDDFLFNYHGNRLGQPLPDSPATPALFLAEENEFPITF
jgi:hypothetical protein